MTNSSDDSLTLAEKVQIAWDEQDADKIFGLAERYFGNEGFKLPIMAIDHNYLYTTLRIIGEHILLREKYAKVLKELRRHQLAEDMDTEFGVESPDFN